jgi:HD-like signal output (HDOD) protein
MLAQILETASSRDIPLVQAEQEAVGYDHAQIAMALAENWNLPTEITLGIGYHHNPIQAPDVFMHLSRVLHIANACCQKGNIGYCDAPQQDEDMFNQCLQALNIEPHALDLIMQEVQQKLTEMEAEGVL